MLIVISPAKTLDFDSKPKVRKFTIPEFLEQSAELNDVLRELAPDQLQALMHISEPLSNLNWQRFQDWHKDFDRNNAKQAVLAFKGDVYTGLEAENMDAKDLNWAQKHLRILSGLYGVLRPLDLMQAYRLEMGTALATQHGKSLYHYWGDKISHALNQQAADVRAKVLVNLASNEYFKSVDLKALDLEVITPSFKDWKNGEYKMIGFFAKKARGRMSAWIIKNRIKNPERLIEFDWDGYRFDKERSTKNNPVFLRKNVEAA